MSKGIKNLQKALGIPILSAILLSAVLQNGTALAFHDGGVGPCEACHTMHNSQGGWPMTTDGQPQGAAHPDLLRSGDSSSTCLLCHEHAGDIGPTGHHVSTNAADMPPGVPPRQLSPGGDFGWLKKTYAWTPDIGLVTEYSYGERHGHNVVAADFSFVPDMTNTAAPGGTYPSGTLACISCHDPHGRYRRNADGSVTTTGKPIRGSGSYAGSPDPDGTLSVGAYRLLGGRNYQPQSGGAPFAFAYDPPAVVAPDAYNRSEAGTQTRVAYGSGMSEWCRNCHPDMHTSSYPGRANLVHPAGSTALLLTTIADRYNAYIKTGDLSGTATSSFLSLVPFEEGTADYGLLKTHARTDDSFLAGPDAASATVMCLTCHRAHASGWDGMTRWNTRTDYIVYSGYYAQEGEVYQPYGQGRTELEALRAYYDKPAELFAPNQEPLCYKCHTGPLP